MFLTEYRKIFSWKPLFFILSILLSINAFVFFHQEQHAEVSSSYYNILWEEIDDKSDSEKLNYLKSELENQSYYYPDGTVNYDRYILMDRFREQLESILSYQDYLVTIENKSSSSSSSNSMFQVDDNTFLSRKNAHLTKVYSYVKNVTPVFDISDGIVKLTSNRYTDLLGSIFVLIIAIIMTVRDREQNMIYLLRSTYNGREKLLLTRFGVIFSVSVMTEFLFFLESLLICRYYYRFGNLFRPLQSLDGFIGCALPISVLEYLFLCFFIKCLYLFLLGTILILICQISKTNLHIIGFSALLYGFEYFLYKNNCGIFSQLNLFCLSNINRMIKTYEDLNLFGFPFSYFRISVITIVVVIIICIVIAMLLEKKCFIEYHSFTISLKIRKSVRIKSRKKYILYQSLLEHKAIYACVLLLLISFLQFYTFKKPYDINDTYYHAYVTQIEKYTPTQTKDYFNSEKVRFDTIEEQYNQLMESGKNTIKLYSLEKQLEPQNSMCLLEEHIEKATNSIGNDVTVFYDSGYIRLFTINSREKAILFLMIFTFLTFVISPCIAPDFENGMIKIIQSTITGKKSYYKDRILLSFHYTLLANIILWGPYIFSIQKNYTLPNQFALIQNIRGFEQIPFHISILNYTILYFSCIFVITFISSLVMLFVSRLTKNQVSTMILNSLIFILPCLLKILGVF